jgi:nitrite reductase/ring-hydroxylating ferredoxin subunit
MDKAILLIENWTETINTLEYNNIYKLKTSHKETICFVKTTNSVKFFKDACPHLGVPLSQSGVCNKFGEIVCKEHAHRYSLVNGFECDGKRETLKFIDTYESEGHLYALANNL